MDRVFDALRRVVAGERGAKRQNHGRHHQEKVQAQADARALRGGVCFACHFRFSEVG
jgi:hypothetical protein